jgi:hypothetical protein
MQIYVVSNPVQNTTNYVCDSQETIDAGQLAGYKGTFSVGTETDANTLLATNQQDFLAEKSGLFCVNEKVTTPDGIQWVNVNLNTEPENTDRVYALLNVPNGDWIQEIGLDAAKSEFSAIEQNYLVYSNLGSYQSWTEWQPLPTPKK